MNKCRTAMLAAQLELFTKRNNPYFGQPTKRRKADDRQYVIIAKSQDGGRGIVESKSGRCRICRNKRSKKGQKAKE